MMVTRLTFPSVALFLLSLSAPASAQPAATGSSSQTPGLVPQLINPDAPTYCRADADTLCGKEEGPAGRACLMNHLDKLSRPCRTALTLTPTTGGPGGFGRPIDAQ